MPRLDGYIRVSRVGGREGEGYIAPDIQRERIGRAEHLRQAVGEDEREERAEAIAADEGFRRRNYPWAFDDEPPVAKSEDDER